MREILFRGKRIDNGEWVEGIPVKTHIGTFIVFEENPHYCNQYGYMEICELALVDPETVGQYTGLTDKNGKKIFEGDIVEKHGGRMYVVEHKGSWMLWDYDENENFLSNWCSAHYFNGENIGGCIVIGNIHDNPELLTQKNI